MTHAWEDRLAIERCLLAALILWPRRVPELEPHHFLAPAHAALYQAIVRSGAQLAVAEKTIPLLREHTKNNASLFAFVGGVENYVITVLVMLDVGVDDAPVLISSVRQCPRCGR